MMEVRLSLVGLSSSSSSSSSSSTSRLVSDSAAEESDVAVSDAPADVFDRRRRIRVNLAADVVLGPLSERIVSRNHGMNEFGYY